MARLSDRRASGHGLTVSTDAGVPVFAVPSEVSRQMEHLWVRLSLHRPRPPSSVAVTSYLRGEGVTVVATALALASSRRTPTLLVDGNIARPGLSVGESAAGIRDVLSGSISLDEAVVATDHDQLAILPVGTSADPGAAADPAPDIHPKLANELLNALAVTFPTVVVDAPSLQEPSAALALASACEASLLTVRHGVTDIDQAQAAADVLADVDLLGVVLNDARLRTPSWLQRRLGGGLR